VSRSLVQQINSAPGVGWVRADSSAIEQLASTEILRLRHRIEELEDEVQKLKTAAPGGTEHLAQGDDQFTMRYLVSLTQQVASYSISHSRRVAEYEVLRSAKPGSGAPSVNAGACNTRR